MLEKRYISRGLKKLCPACGKTRIFTGWNRVIAKCPSCGLDLHQREGDCWAFVYFSMAGLIGVMAIAMIFTFQSIANAIGFRLAQIGFFILTFILIVWTLPYRKSLALSLDYAFENKDLPEENESDTKT